MHAHVRARGMHACLHASVHKPPFPFYVGLGAMNTSPHALPGPLLATDTDTKTNNHTDKHKHRHTTTRIHTPSPT
jgi:hypothetical protein